MSPFFTIITASCNNASTIINTLESIKGQSFKSIEHIVSDGGSEDHTPKILEKYGKAYNLKWISEPDNGIADALNKGLAWAQGRYIVVIQADDQLFDSNILNNVYQLLKSEGIDIWSFPVVFNHHAQGQVIRKPIKIFWWNHFKFIFLHQGCFVHQRVFERIGGFREEFKICMDYDFFYRALAEPVSVKFGSHPVALMGGTGVGSDLKFIHKRLSEEKQVQVQNEQSPGWKTAQFIFRLIYRPYKRFRLRLAVADKSIGNGLQ